MKNCYYHIELDGRVFLSNLPKEMMAMASSSPFGHEVTFSPDRSIKIRWKKEKIEGGTVYMCTFDQNVTRKIFDYYFDAFLMMYSSLNVRLQEMVQTNTSSIRRLQHNVNTYNAKIQDDLEELVSIEDISEKDWKKIIEIVDQTVIRNTRKTAITLLKIAKNAALVSAEMDVYDYLQNSKGMLDFHRHPIHKVVKLSLQPFFLDFLEKKISVEIGACKDYVKIDFSSVSVVLGHFWNNAVKYSVKDAKIGIEFSSDNNNVIMKVSMASLQITDEDYENMYEEGYSGYWAKIQALDGSGIGMYYIKRLMNLNKGDFSIERGNNNFLVDGIPYSTNTFSFFFVKAGGDL